MSMFISKALRRAEVFLEKVDESVAQASRRLVVDGAVADVDESYSSEDETNQQSRASAIPRAEHPKKPSLTESFHPPATDQADRNGWNEDIQIGENMLQPFSESDKRVEIEAPCTNNSLRSQPDTLHEKEESSLATIPKLSIQNQSQPDETLSGVQSNSLYPKPDAEDPHATDSEEYIQALEVENTELRTEFESLEAEYEDARKEKVKLAKVLKRMRTIINEMDETMQEKSAEARTLESELIVANDKISVLESESKRNEAQGKGDIGALRKEFTVQVNSLQEQVDSSSQENQTLKEENDRLNETLMQGHEAEVATADGARQDATQAHRAYEAETLAHRETRKLAKEHEEALQAEVVTSMKAVADAQKKAEECIVAASKARSVQRAAGTKLVTVTSARNAAFARIEDLEETVRFYEDQNGTGSAAQGNKEIQETISELENALEAKNVELNRLEGEVESLRASVRPKKDVMSPRTSPRMSSGTTQEVEVKLRHMADATLRKQAQLEVLRSENRALQHQLVSERKRTREAQAMAAAASSSGSSIRGGFRGILDSGGEGDRGERMYGVREGPLARFRTPRQWPRTVSKMVMGLDHFSAQALAFLRKEPLLRLVLLFYVVALHIFIYRLLHWHVDVVSQVATHASAASIKSGAKK